MRSLARERTFAAVAVISIATGVGATTALFSVVNALWLRPLPVHAPERLGLVYSRPAAGQEGAVLPGISLRSGRALQTLSGLEGVAYQLQPVSPLLEWTKPHLMLASTEIIESLAVSHAYFSVLGVPLLGRGFVEAEEDADAMVAVLSGPFATQLYGSAQAALGKDVVTTRGALTVIGVAVKQFRGARLEDRVDIWIPLGSVTRFSHYPAELIATLGVTPIVRLKHGVQWTDVAPAVRDLTGGRGHIRPLSDVRFLVRSDGSLVRQEELLTVLWVTTTLIMFAGCTNLAAVLLARAERRSHEIAVRSSLGASPRSLVGLILLENFCLVIFATPIALAIAMVVCDLLGRHTMPGGLPLALIDLSVDWRVAVFAFGMTCGGVVLAGVMPLRYATRRNVTGVLATTKGGGDRTATLTRQWLLGVHVALSVALLTGAATLVGRIAALLHSDQGIATTKTFVVGVSPSFAEYAVIGDGGQSRQERDFHALSDRIGGLPGVAFVSYGAVPFPSPGGGTTRDVRSTDDSVASALLVNGGPRYAAAIGARIIEGRDLSESDLGVAPRPSPTPNRQPDMIPGAIVELSAARQLWPSTSAVGKTFRVSGRLVQVVGVFDELLPSASTRLSVPLVVVGRRVSAEVGQALPQILVHTSSTVSDVEVSLSTMASEAFAGRPRARVKRLDRVVREALANEYMGATVFAGFGTAAAVLGVAGIYGMVSFVMARGRRDIAIRMALGASRSSVTLSSLRQPLLPVSLGILGGLGIARAGSGLLDSSVLGLEAIPLWPYVASAGVFVVAAAAAAWTGSRGVRQIAVFEALRTD